MQFALETLGKLTPSSPRECKWAIAGPSEFPRRYSLFLKVAIHLGDQLNRPTISSTCDWEGLVRHGIGSLGTEEVFSSIPFFSRCHFYAISSIGQVDPVGVPGSNEEDDCFSLRTISLDYLHPDVPRTVPRLN